MWTGGGPGALCFSVNFEAGEAGMLPTGMPEHSFTARGWKPWTVLDWLGRGTILSDLISYCIVLSGYTQPTVCC